MHAKNRSINSVWHLNIAFKHPHIEVSFYSMKSFSVNYGRKAEDSWVRLGHLNC